jgi:biotin operon repressor
MMAEGIRFLVERGRGYKLPGLSQADGKQVNDPS